jgi:hypothetical protein
MSTVIMQFNDAEKTTLTAGWDPVLDRWFMVLETNRSEEPVWSNLDHNETVDWTFERFVDEALVRTRYVRGTITQAEWENFTCDWHFKQDGTFGVRK